MRKRVLYLGLRARVQSENVEFIHFPIIRIKPSSLLNADIAAAMERFNKYTHLILTSQSTLPLIVECAIAYGKRDALLRLPVIAVGQSTASLAASYGFAAVFTSSGSFRPAARRPSVASDSSAIASAIASSSAATSGASRLAEILPEEVNTAVFATLQTPHEESAEGMVSLMKTMNLSEAFLFWPHSALSRRILPDYFHQQQIHFQECILYDTKINDSGPLPNLELIDEIIFTSPSTIDAFKKLFGKLPQDKILTPIGPVTAAYLESFT